MTLHSGYNGGRSWTKQLFIMHIKTSVVDLTSTSDRLPVR